MAAQSIQAGVRPSRLRVAGCLLLFVLLYCPLLLYYALTAPVFLDEGSALEHLRHSPADLRTREDYFFAIDHPALFRWCNRAVLRLLNIPIGDVPAIDPRHADDPQWHIAHGRIAPRRPVNALRAVNALLLAGALVAIFFATRLALGGRVWGFLVAAPLGLPPALGTYVGAYIQADPYLAFFIALALAVWLKQHLSPRPDRFAHIIVMGILAGLAVSTKLNGGLVALAYVCYVAVRSKGLDIVWRPAAFLLVVFVTFVALNPVMQRGGLALPFDVMRDILNLRRRIFAYHDARFEKVPWEQLVKFMFPYWYLLPLLGILVYHARREPWFLPVSLWAGFLMLGTALTTRYTFERYLMPLHFGLFTLVMLSAITVSRRLYRGEIRFRDLLTTPRSTPSRKTP